MLRIVSLHCFYYFALFLSGVPFSHGASLTIAPTQVEISAPNSSGTLALYNNGDSPVAVHMRLFRWSQDVLGKENLEPASGLAAVSPPMVKIPPKERYTLRIVRLNSEPLKQEEAYRLYIDEIPVSNKETGGQISIALRYNVPVIFMPSGYHHHKLTWSIQKERGRAYLIVKNEGSRRAHISHVKIQQGPLKVDVSLTGTNTLLAHASRRFDISETIALFKKGHSLTVSIDQNGETSSFDIAS